MKIEILEIKNILPYIGNNIVVRNELYLQNYNGNEFGILNGIYPLYNSRVEEIFWQFTTNNNSTGQPIKYCQLLLRPLSDVGKQNGTTKNKYVIPILFCAYLAGLKITNMHDLKSQGFEVIVENTTIIIERKIKKVKTITTFECFEIDLDKFGFDWCYVAKDKKTGFELKTVFKLVEKPKEIIEYLYKEGFDLNNLIEKGLALNINDYPQHIK